MHRRHGKTRRIERSSRRCDRSARGRRSQLNRTRDWRSSHGWLGSSSPNRRRCWRADMLGSGRRRCRRRRHGGRQIGQRRARLRALSVLGLRRSRGSRACAQLLTGRFACPCTGINFANDVQPLLSLGERAEVPHVESEPLTAFLEPAAHEKGKALQLGQIHLSKRHRRRRRAEIENEWTRLRCGGSRGLQRLCAPNGARGHIWRW
jgi:hypothetical protein